MTENETYRGDNTAHLISAIRREVNALLVQRLQDAGMTDLAPSHGDIIVALIMHKSMTMTDLAKRINRDPSTVTTLVNKLRKAGYVESQRAERDTRVRVIALTPQGRALEHVIAAISAELVQVIWRDISENDRKATRRILHQIHDNLVSANEH